MSDIVKFIEDRLADDERIARAATQRKWEWKQHKEDEWCLRAGDTPVIRALSYETPYLEVSDADEEHIARHDPARVLREVEGKRAIVAECADNLEVPGGWECEDTPKLAWFTLCGLAAAWSEHPDYDQGWALVDAEEES